MKHLKKLKKMVILMMAFVMIFGSVNVSAATVYKSGGRTRRYYGKNYKIYYNSKQISSSKKPALLINGNIQISYNLLSQKGPKVKYTYNKAKKQLTLTYNDKEVVLTANKKVMTVNGVTEKLYSAPVFVKYSGYRSYTLMIPAKAVTRALGLTYSYDKARKSVYITAPTQTTNSPAVGVNNSGTAVTTTNYGNITANVFSNMSLYQFISTMGPIAQEDYHKSGVLASVTMAQAILESGWGKSALAKSANNMFGMKTNLSGNTWAGSTWDGCSAINILTGEEYSGKHVTIQAAFRKYSSVAQSVADHSAYLVNAKNGLTKRYAGLTDTKNYYEQLTIIKKGGYATSSNYVSQLSALITKYNLTQFDK